MRLAAANYRYSFRLLSSSHPLLYLYYTIYVPPHKTFTFVLQFYFRAIRFASMLMLQSHAYSFPSPITGNPCCLKDTIKNSGVPHSQYHRSISSIYDYKINSALRSSASAQRLQVVAAAVDIIPRWPTDNQRHTAQLLRAAAA